MVTYCVEKGQLMLIDPDVDLNVTLPFSPPLLPADPHHQEKVGKEAVVFIHHYLGGEEELHMEKGGVWEGEYKLLYPNGALKLSSFYQRGELHGPSRFYSEEGNLLCESWFLNGKREGKCRFFYATGEKYSLQSYREGLFQGKQLYWYPDGTLKTTMEYDKGALKGKTLLYYPDGTLKRSLTF